MPLTTPAVTTVQDETVAVTPRTTLDFQGAGVSAADSGGKTVVTIPGATAGTPRIIGAVGTNLGAAQTVTFSGAEEVWLLGTLDAATLTVTLAGRTAGARLLILALQDATGGRGITVSDGSGSQALTGLPTSAGALVLARAFCPNSTDIDCEVPSGSSASDASTSVKGITLMSVAPVSAASPIAVGDNDTRMTNARTPTSHASSHALGGSDPVIPNVPANTQTASYTLVLGDAGKSVEGNHATVAVAITVPPNSSVAFPIGTVIEVCRVGAAAMTVTPGAGVTIPNRIQAAGTSARTLVSQYSSASLRKRATDEWVLVGDIS